MLDWVFAHDLSQDISQADLLPSNPSDFQMCQIHIGCITKIPFKFELLMEKKKILQSGINFYRNFNQFLWPPASFPMSPYVKKRSFQRSHCVAMTSLERASPRANMMPSQGKHRGFFSAAKWLSETTILFIFSWMQRLTFQGNGYVISLSRLPTLRQSAIYPVPSQRSCL